MRLVSNDAREVPAVGLCLNVIFTVPGRLVEVNWDGVAWGRFYRKRNLLAVGAAVPDDLVPVETTTFIRSALVAAVDLAADYMRRKRVAVDDAPVRALAARVAEQLPDRPLDGRERFREYPGSGDGAGPIRAFVELNGAGAELRRIEAYADGRMDYAVQAIETGTTNLRRESSAPAGGRLMPEAEFDSTWQKAIDQSVPRGPIRVVEYPNT